MREIKFRAWDYQNNQWATDSDVLGSVGLTFGVKDYFINIAGEKAVRFDFQQFTGLKDKHGKEIYEGDIIRNDDLDCVVEYNAPSFVRHVINFDLRNSIYPFKSHHEYEIIGNIHSNPELLK